MTTTLYILIAVLMFIVMIKLIKWHYKQQKAETIDVLFAVMCGVLWPVMLPAVFVTALCKVLTPTVNRFL